jgi:hypothetical protein
MKTKIFAYKGRVGILAGDKFVNDPSQPNQLGCVVKLSEVEVSREAFEILNNIKRSHDDIGDVMCWGECFAWLGGPKTMLNDKAEGDNSYQPSLLVNYIADVEIPEEFKNAVDKIKMG